METFLVLAYTCAFMCLAEMAITTGEQRDWAVRPDTTDTCLDPECIWGWVAFAVILVVTIVGTVFPCSAYVVAMVVTALGISVAASAWDASSRTNRDLSRSMAILFTFVLFTFLFVMLEDAGSVKSTTACYANRTFHDMGCFTGCPSTFGNLHCLAQK